MDREDARVILDAAHETAQAIVNANPDLSFKEAGLMFDRVFFGLLSDKLGEMKILDFFRIIDSSG
jgi:hypothetical protein